MQKCVIVKYKQCLSVVPRLHLSNLCTPRQHSTGHSCAVGADKLWMGRIILTILLEGTKFFLSYRPWPRGSRHTSGQTGSNRSLVIWAALGFTATDKDVLKGEPAEVFCAPYLSAQCLPVLEHSWLSDTQRVVIQ